MIEGFNVWITSMIGMGILILLIQLIVPKSNLKKYIYSLIGVLSILVIVSPVLKILESDTVEQGVKQVLNDVSNMDSNNDVKTNKLETLNQEAVKLSFLQKLEQDMLQKLEQKGVKVKDLEVTLDDEYNIDKVSIEVDSYEGEILNEVGVKDVLKTEYDIPISNINVRWVYELFGNIKKYCKG